MIREQAVHMPRVSFVDAYDISLTTDGRGRPELFVADRLHFNAHGYKLLAERVRPYLTAASDLVRQRTARPKGSGCHDPPAMHKELVLVTASPCRSKAWKRG